MTVVPVSCRLSATGIRFSGHPFPPRSWAFLTVGLPDTVTTRTLTGFPRSTRTSNDRGGCLLYPEGGGAHPIGKKSPTGACRSSTASPYTPLQQPISEAHNNETSTEVHAIHPSGLALTCSPRMERGPSGLNPELRTPPLPVTHVRAGRGQRARTSNYTTDIAGPPTCEFTRYVRPRVAIFSWCRPTRPGCRHRRGR